MKSTYSEVGYKTINKNNGMKISSFSKLYFRELQTLCEQCSYLDFFWSLFPRTGLNESNGRLKSNFLCSVRMQENMDQVTSEYVHFLCSEDCYFWPIS